MRGLYSGASAVLATMHGKESVIAPAMARHLGLKLVTPLGLDTDTLGTFTGETPRVGTMRDAAIQKARMGMALSGLPIGVASEGSFGPHPTLPFLSVGMEVMVFVDDARGIIVSESLIADDVHYEETVATNVSELDDFLRRVGFPEQALIVRPNLTASPWWKLHPELMEICKGVSLYQDLAEAVESASRASEDRCARVALDLRAHKHPARMKAIGGLADKLARRIATECPRCGTPGFGDVMPASGLPCVQCGRETIAVRGQILKCPACRFESEEALQPIRTYADPADCPQCNP
jgi:hypothetical protein